MPTARSGTGIAALDGKIYVLGGEGWVDDFGGVFRANEVYDPSTNTWSRAARMITPRHGFAVAQVGKTIYAVSGVNNAGGAGTLSVVPVNEIVRALTNRRSRPPRRSASTCRPRCSPAPTR